MPPGERARRWQDAYEQGRATLRKPPLSPSERDERLARLTAQFTAERDAFFAKHPERWAPPPAICARPRAPNGPP